MNWMNRNRISRVIYLFMGLVFAARSAAGEPNAPAVTAAPPSPATPAAAVSASLPVFPRAKQVMRAVYQDLPKEIQEIGAIGAYRLVYQVPGQTNLATLSSFYARELGRTRWVQKQSKMLEGEQSYLYQRSTDQLVLVLRQQPEQVQVEALGLIFPVQAPSADLAPNQGQVLFSRRLARVPAGIPVHLLCPQGMVTVRTHATPDLELDVLAHAAVDYPLLADTFLKHLQLTGQVEPTEVVLGIDSNSVPQEESLHLAYDCRLSVPEGTTVRVEVGRPSEASLNITDGKVDVDGPVGDVLVRTSGPVWVTGASGKVDVLTVNNPVVLQDLKSDISVHTSGMLIKAYGLSLNGAVDLETTDARVDARVTDVQDGSIRCVTTTSPISLWLPPDPSLDLTVTGVLCQSPYKLAPVPGPAGAPRFHTVVNGGRIPVDLQTSGEAMVFVHSPHAQASQSAGASGQNNQSKQ